MDPFQTLGIEPRLVFSREELNQAFREAGKAAHPDAGGNEDLFAELQRAFELLQSPARRLKAWLELKGFEVETRGAIGNETMDLFSKVGEVTQRAESLIRRRDAAKSVLAKALLEGETHQCREEVEGMIAEVECAIDAACQAFAVMEQSEPEMAAGCALYRDLSFLEKWQSGLRSLFAKLL